MNHKTKTSFVCLNCLTIGLLAVCLATSSVADEVPQLLRLAIVDDSNSMAGERIASVRQELASVAKQLPPSKTHPIVLVKFGSTVAPPIAFTDLATFEAAIALLQGNSGGTNIAAGLNEAVRQVERQRSSNDVWVLLFTDGEDINQTGIAQAEEQLDAVFADRQQHQLKQTVFCKRWGNSNAQLIQKLRERGRAVVIDAGQLTVRPLTFTPAVDVTDVAWDGDDPNRLNVTYSVRIDVQGDLQGLTLPAMTAHCALSKLTGDIDTEVTPGTPSIVGRKVRVPVSAADRTAGRLRIPFTFTLPNDIPAQDAKVLPQLAANTVEVPVPFPADKYTFRISSELTPQQGTWIDTTAKRVRYPVKLKLLVTCKEGANGTPGDVQLIPQADSVIISGPPVIKLPGTGAVEADYVVETTVKNATETCDQWRCSLEFEGQPTNTPPNMTFEPPVWKIQADAPVPSPVTTTITGRVVQLSPPQWVNFAQGVAAFDADTEFDVQGPIAAKTVLNLLTSGPVVSLDLEPGILRAGTQRVRLKISAAVHPSPQSTSFESCIIAPTGDGVIAYQVGSPLTFSVTGPAAVALAMARGGRQVRELRAGIADNEHVARVPFEAIVAGHRHSPLIGDLDVALTPQTATLRFSANGVYRAYRRNQLTISVPTPSERSFFRDITVTGSAELKPDHANTAVTPTSIPIRVIVAAPFKRLALYLAVGLSVLVTGIMLVRLFITLRRTE